MKKRRTNTPSTDDFREHRQGTRPAAMGEVLNHQNKLDFYREPQAMLARRTWLLVGLVTFAMLLMPVTVLLFHHRLEVAQLIQAWNAADQDKDSVCTVVESVDYAPGALVSVTSKKLESYRALYMKLRNRQLQNALFGTRATRRTLDSKRKGRASRRAPDSGEGGNSARSSKVRNNPFLNATSKAADAKKEPKLNDGSARDVHGREKATDSDGPSARNGSSHTRTITRNAVTSGPAKQRLVSLSSGPYADITKRGKAMSLTRGVAFTKLAGKKETKDFNDLSASYPWSNTVNMSTAFPSSNQFGVSMPILKYNPKILGTSKTLVNTKSLFKASLEPSQFPESHSKRTDRPFGVRNIKNKTHSRGESRTKKGRGVNALKRAEKLGISTLRPAFNKYNVVVSSDTARLYTPVLLPGMNSFLLINRTLVPTAEVTAFDLLSLGDITQGVHVVSNQRRKFLIQVNLRRNVSDKALWSSITLPASFARHNRMIKRLDNTEATVSVRLTRNESPRHTEKPLVRVSDATNHPKKAVFVKGSGSVDNKIDKINSESPRHASAESATLMDLDIMKGSVDSELRMIYNLFNARNGSVYRTWEDMQDPASWFGFPAFYSSSTEQTSEQEAEKDRLGNRDTLDLVLTKKETVRNNVTASLNDGSLRGKSTPIGTSDNSPKGLSFPQVSTVLWSSAETEKKAAASEKLIRRKQWSLRVRPGVQTSGIEGEKNVNNVDSKSQTQIIQRNPAASTVLKVLIPLTSTTPAEQASSNHVVYVADNDKRNPGSGTTRQFLTSPHGQMNRSLRRESGLPQNLTWKNRKFTSALLRNGSTTTPQEFSPTKHRPLWENKLSSESVQATWRKAQAKTIGRSGPNRSVTATDETISKGKAYSEPSKLFRVRIKTPLPMRDDRSLQRSRSETLQNDQSTSTTKIIAPVVIKRKNLTEDLNDYLESAFDFSSSSNSSYNLLTNSLTFGTRGLSNKSRFIPYSSTASESNSRINLISTVQRVPPTSKTVSTTRKEAGPSLACAYHRKHVDWKIGDKSFNLTTFPYRYCTLIVYCCAALDFQFGIDPHEYESDVRSLKEAKKSHPELKTFVAIEDSNARGATFIDIATEKLHWETFVNGVASWLLKRNFDGVYIYQTRAEPKDMKRLVRTSTHMLQSLRKSNLQFGLILPSDERSLLGFDVPGLARLLKGVPAGIILSPSERKEDEYTKTYFERADDLLKQFAMIQDVTKNDSSSVCPMLPFAGASFKLQAFIQRGDVALKPVGKGEPGPVSREAGKAAYFEVCKRQEDSNHFVFATRESAMVRGAYITYLTPRALANLLGFAAIRRPLECLGAWEPEWDDFGGTCDEGEYPLLRTLYMFLSPSSPHNSAK